MRAKVLVVLALAGLLTPLAVLPAQSTTYCFGVPSTMTALPGVTTYGTDGDDVIVGTEGSDRIRGGKGKDRICGLGGSDDLRGGSGRDRISGGAGDDLIYGDGGRHNVLNGGVGNDTIIAKADGDAVAGNAGADDLSTHGADYTAVAGGPGNDTIATGAWAELDGGDGTDRCALSTGVVPANCETLRLTCDGLNYPLPTDLEALSGLSSATGDFDGDGVTDTIYMWNDLFFGWYLHVELANGFGAQHNLDKPAEMMAALGGYDINGDGIDEIFIQAGSNPRPVIGIGALWLPLAPDPLTCTVEGPEFGLGGDPFFAIGESPDNYATEYDNGLACLPADHMIRLFVQQPVDANTFLQHRYDQTYEPHFGVRRPEFNDGPDHHIYMDWPEDQGPIERAREFHCPGMALP